MSDPHNPNQTVDLPTAAQLMALRRQFEAAWQEALQGGTQPQIETYLALAPEPERLVLHRELSQIEQAYQQRRQGPNGAAEADEKTIPVEPTDPSPPPSLDSAPTVELSHPTAELASALTATVDPDRGIAFDSRAGNFSLAAEALAPAAGAGPIVAGYELLAEMGRGGMGVVYKARQVGLNRPVALKMVLAATYAGPHQLARFSTEAQAVAQLQHPNIVQIYEVGEHQGLPFFSLELLEGGSLTQKIAGKPRPPVEAAQTVLPLALAMAVAHEQGIIHRDLKPANVLLAADGTPKITDFGLAKRLEDDSSHTRTGTLMGTPSYMSPEQARGDSHTIGPLSDLYSLGAILYELLTGRPPFAGPTMLETLHMVRNADPVPPRRLQPTCPRDLETICLKCLQKEPHKRYPSCAALAQDLCRFLAGELIHARPVGRLERLWSWCRRNPRVASLSAAVGVLLLVVAVTLAVVAVRVGREREAVAETRKAAGQRLEQATEAVAGGNYQRAQDLLHWSDPLLSTHPNLGDLRAEMDTLKRQVDVYAEFKSLLDNARFACRFGSRPQKEQGQRYGRQLLKLYDEIDKRQGRAEAGLPPLATEQKRLFKEDVFEAFLVAALVERELAEGAGPEAQKKAAQQAIDWLNRAERVLPGTRALYVQRAPCWGKLGNAAADKADIDRASAIAPTSAVDRFWHGFANHLRGDAALKKGDVKTAHEFYRKEIADYAAFLQMRPDHFWGYFNWAVCQVQLDDLHDALIGFTACVRLRPDFPWPYNNRGTVHLRLGQLDLAVADFSAALERDDHYAEAHANRALAYLAQGKEGRALEGFARALALNPDYAPAYAERAEVHRKRKRYDETVADYTRLLALSTDRASVHARRAEVYRAMNRPEEAIKDYDQLVPLRPTDPQPLFDRAGLHHARGDYRKADDDFSRVLALAPNATKVLRIRALIRWYNLKDFDASLSDWERLAKLQPKNAEPHRCIGVIHLGRRRYDEALQALHKALALKPDYTEAKWAVAQVYHWQGKPREALEVLAPVVARLPNDLPETLNVRGEVFRSMARFEEAAADYRRLIQLKPKDLDAYVEAHVSLALVYERQNKPERAQQCYEQLVAAAADSARAYLRRAEYRRDRGDFAGALADCATARRKEPGSALPALLRASVEAARGREREAVAQAEEALKKAAPHDGRALYAAACVWGLASAAAAKTGNADDARRANEYADRAAALLADALDKGFHDLFYPEHNRMADDPALAAVRQHPRVRALLARRP